MHSRSRAGLAHRLVRTGTPARGYGITVGFRISGDVNGDDQLRLGLTTEDGQTASRSDYWASLPDP
jgi:hypothetical protein